MNKFKTLDGVEIEMRNSRFHPDGPQDGMAPAMSYLWIKTPNLGWIKPYGRSTIVVREVIENNTLVDLEFFITSNLV